MKPALLKYLVLTLLLAFCSGMQAEEIVTFHNMTMGEGLVSNQITALYRDSKGFLWVGTQEGLDRYDAYRFTHFTLAEGLPGRNISALAEDPSGRIWIQSQEGIRYFDYSDNEIHPLESALEEMGFPETAPSIFGSDESLRYFWVYDGSQVSVFDARSASISSFPTGDSPVTKLSFQNNRLYFARQDTRLFQINLQTDYCREVDLPEPVRQRFGSGSLQVFADNSDGLWLYAFLGSTVFHFAPSDGWQEFLLPVVIDQFNRITDIAEDSAGNIWITTSHHGAFRIGRNDEILHLTHEPNKSFSLPGNNLVALHVDRDDIVWIGNFKLGLSCYAPGSQAFLHYNTEGTNDILTACQTARGLYLGTDGSGLLRAPDYDSPFQPVETGANVINCLAQDADGNLWLGTWERGLIQLDDRDRVRNVFLRENSGLAQNSIFKIIPAEDGSLFLAIHFGSVQRFNPQTREFTSLFHDASLRINDLSRIDQNTLIAATSGGLVRIHLESGQTEFLQDAPDFPFKTIIADVLFQDSRSLLWMGGDEGIWQWDPATGEGAQMGFGNGWPSATAFAEDVEGRLWVGSSHGLSLLSGDVRTPMVYNYSSREGLSWVHFNDRAMATLQNGNIILAGTPQGFTIIPYEHSDEDDYQAHVFLTGVEMGEDFIETLDGKSLLDVSEIVLKESQLPLSLHFSSLDFNRQNAVFFEYQIAGRNSQWQRMVGNVVSFSVLPPRKYEIQIRAGNAHQSWSPDIKTVTVIVRPPWYRSLAAMLVYVFAALAALTYLALHIRRQRRQKAEIARINQEAEDQRRLLDMKLTFFANVSHELRTPLSLIINPLDEFVSRYPQYGTGFLATARSNADYLKDLIDQLLSFRKIDAGGEKMHYIRQDIVTCLRDVFLNYQPWADKRRISYRFETEPEVIEMDFDRSKMTKVLHNLLSNAFKFTPDGGRIEVLLSRAGQNFQLQVADDGKGIPEADRTKVFDMFYQSEEDSRSQGGSGIGLYLVDQYVKMHGGSIQVTGNQPRGTVFHIEIPVDAPAGIVSEPATTVPAESSEIRVYSSQSRQYEYTLLLVDDNLEFLDFVSDSLSSLYRIYHASDGASALDILHKEHIDLVISDVMMPNMSGLELCQKIRSDRQLSGIPVILLTAKAGEEFQLEGLKYGADDYITKPFSMDILKMRIRKFTEEKRDAEDEDNIRASRIEITPMDKQFVSKAVSLVEENLANADFSVEDLAARMNISRGYLYRKISRITRKTPIEFIRIIRMQRAQQLLAESQLQVAEVAYKLGYNSPKTFTKHFKMVFGTSPSDYIRSWKKQ